MWSLSAKPIHEEYFDCRQAGSVVLMCERLLRYSMGLLNDDR